MFWISGRDLVHNCFSQREAPTEMEAGTQGQTLEESSNEKPWEYLFTKCSDAREIILDSLDLETALACRLVCKEWRETVDYYTKLWAKISKVFSIAVKL